MALHPAADQAPADFLEAISTLRGLELRPEIRLQEVPAPAKLSPFSVALTAEILPDDEEIGEGRFVILYDPSRFNEWGGQLRIVALLRSEVETDIGEDHMLADVAWTWLTEALDESGASWCALGGTTTVVSSRPHGDLDEGSPTVDVQIRASWTATSLDLSHHLLAWLSTLSQASGLPPLSESVVSLGRSSQTG